MLTLWDLIPAKRAAPKPRSARRPAPQAGIAPEPGSAEARYLRLEREMLARHAVRVRKWRSGSSGVAWQVLYQDGSVSRLIEAPRPRGPVSAAIFLHEIGHHAIGFATYKPRCLEEYHAWRFALDEMERWGLAITPRVRTRVRDSLKYAVEKAERRGLKHVPHEVAACITEQEHLLAQEISRAPRRKGRQ